MSVTTTTSDSNPTFRGARMSVPDVRVPAIISLPETAQFETQETLTDRLAALLELVVRIQQSPNADTACRALATQMAEYLRASQVVVGLCGRPGTACQVRAFSDQDTFNETTEGVRLAQAVLQESIARNELTSWPPNSQQSQHALLTHRQYAAFGGYKTVLSSPLRDDTGCTLGAWFATFSETSLDAKNARRFMHAAELPVSATLGLVKRAERGIAYRAASGFIAGVRRKKVIATAAALFATIAILCIPVTCNIACTCTIEPVVRRHVAAPFAGPLNRTFVEPGDFVKEGQLLAEMDGRETSWDLAGVLAEYHRAVKERAGHVATHDSGKAEVARHEIDRLKLRKELLEHRESNVQIRSPIDGMVVAGDLKKSEGMPLAVGQNLFEIAPIDHMVVEVAVPEADIAYVRPGMLVTIRLDSEPFTTRQAKVERIQPRSEIRDQENVFIAEVRLDNTNDDLRPGMHGDASVASGRYPLGWNLLRKPLAAALAWMGW